MNLRAEISVARRLYLGQFLLFPRRAAREADVVARLLLDAVAAVELGRVHAELGREDPENRQPDAVRRLDVVLEQSLRGHDRLRPIFLHLVFW